MSCDRACISAETVEVLLYQSFSYPIESAVIVFHKFHYLSYVATIIAMIVYADNYSLLYTATYRAMCICISLFFVDVNFSVFNRRENKYEVPHN